MYKDKIEVGDIVQVVCNTAQTTILFLAEVMYIPKATGDSWQFKDISVGKKNGTIVYINEGITITLIAKERSQDDEL